MAARRRSLAKSLGRRIARLREDAGTTQEQLAWAADLESKGYLSRIESGQRLPSLAVLERLARELNADPRDLLLFPDSDETSLAMERIRVGGKVAAKRVIAFLDDEGIRTQAAPSASERIPVTRRRSSGR